MNVGEIVIRTMTSNGWQQEPTRNPSEVDARVTWSRPGTRLTLEHRAERHQLWLWIHSLDDKRCLGLTYGQHVDRALAKIAALRDRLSLDEYLAQYGELQSVCPVDIIAYEQFEKPQDCLRESYAVQLLYDAPIALDADGIWHAFHKERPQAQRLGALHFAHADGAQSAVLDGVACTPAELAPALGQTWGWNEAGELVARARFAVTVTDLVSGGVTRGERLSRFFSLLRAVQSRHMPLAIHWAPAQWIVNPAPVMQVPPEGELSFAVNVRFWSGGGMAEGESFMDTRGLDAFGLFDIEARFRQLDPGYMARCLQTIAQHVWNGAVFTDPDSINGLGEDPWITTHRRATVEPYRPVLNLAAGRHASG